MNHNMSWGSNWEIEVAELDPTTQEYLHEVGDYLLGRKAQCEAGQYYRDQGDSQYGNRFGAFREIDNEQRHIRAAFASSEQDEADSDEWPAYKMLTLCDDLVYATLPLAEPSGRARVSDAAKGAYEVQYRVAQYAAADKERLMELACHDNPEVSGRARRLLFHYDVTLPSFRDAALSLPFADEVLEYDMTHLPPRKVGERLHMFVCHVVDGGDTDVKESLLATLHDCDIPDEILMYTASHFSLMRGKLGIASLDNIMMMARLKSLSKGSFGAQPTWEQDVTDLLEEATQLDSPIGRGVRKDLTMSMLAYPKQLDQCMASYGFTLDHLESAWRDALGDNHEARMGNYRGTNIECIATLEARHPGSAKVLHDTFNIRNFARYPYAVLERQYLDTLEAPLVDEDGSRPLVNHVYVANYDHSAAFSSMLNLQAVAERIWDAGQRLEIYEVSKPGDIIQAILNSSHLLGTAILTGHSDGCNVDLGRFDGLYQAEIKRDMTRRYMRRLAGRFAVGATVIMNSCSTGQPGRLGEAISNALDVEVIAPVVPSALMRFDKDTSYPEPGPAIPLGFLPVYTRDRNDGNDPARRIVPALSGNE